MSTATETPSRTIPTTVATVTATRTVGTELRQLTFTGLGDLPPLHLDDFFLVIRPHPTTAHLLDGPVTFEDLRTLPSDLKPDWAYYTSRRHRPGADEMDVWVAIHDGDGPMSAWARRARAGDRVALWGPRSAFSPPSGTSSILLLADATGLGAVASILETAPAGWKVDVIVESVDGTPSVALPARSGASIRWASSCGDAKRDCLQMLDAVEDEILECTGLYAYGAGEFHTMRDVGHELERRGLAPGQHTMVGYWRRKQGS